MAAFLPVLRAMNDAGVSYVVVGGLATILHGHPRVTTDVDLVIGLEPSNVLRAMDVLSAQGFEPRLPVRPADFADPAIRSAWVRDRGMVVFSFYHRSNPTVSVDLFAEYPLDIQQLLQNAVAKDVAGVAVKVCSLDDLIAMKRAVGRPIDLDDVQKLERLRGQPRQ